MSTKKERQTGELRSICGYVEKSQIEALKEILGQRGWQEKLINQSLRLSIAFLQTASRYEVVDFLFSDHIEEFFTITSLSKEESSNDETP